MVLSAGKPWREYLIIARAAENRIWPGDSARPGLTLARSTESVGHVLATLPGAQGPWRSPSESTLWAPQACPLKALSALPRAAVHAPVPKRRETGQSRPFLSWSDSCDPYKECTLVWRRRPGWVGCCVPKPGFVALYTYYVRAQMYRLRLVREYIQTHISSVVNCTAPCLSSLKHRFMCMQNFVSWDWAQGGAGCTQQTLSGHALLETCVCTRVCAGIGVCGLQEPADATKAFWDLLAFTVQAAGLGQ